MKKREIRNRHLIRALMEKAPEVLESRYKIMFKRVCQAAFNKEIRVAMPKKS